MKNRDIHFADVFPAKQSKDQAQMDGIFKELKQ